MAILFTFPGQGTQKAGMLTDLQQFPIGQQLLNRASHHLGQDVLELDNETALLNNRNTQVALTICSYAYAQILRDLGMKPEYVLGLSIGAFPAAISAGIISYEQGLDLVTRRGELMANAYPEGYAMAAVIGLPLPTLKQLLADATEQGHVVYIANINTESQVVISGRVDSLQAVCDLALTKQATSARLLKVNVPSHCALLANQAEQFSHAFESLEFKRPNITYVSANAARVLVPVERIRDDLTHNMARQVHWWETIAMLKERGVTLAIEMKPGSVLTGLCKASMPDTISVAAESENLANLAALARKYG
ncbi:ACP S-malonyltransferase [Vibrio nitrifigilis]|uniref:Malonyl CoA-acyl carrier protein transacylase n=1 Tax=Vibrio nitrifigilis TaxID=2789781 RepID=A0ABS0GF07_9VIBR|nr:malonate decarboxylase subunit epsilon [Vibrio nitrifigilis]MBF9001007.1 malonate decarboxylase subunit epsilon [Vibrio nitrifigilis]